MKTDTIVAIATAMSNSGIGIIRISGEESFSVIQRMFRKKNGKEIDVEKTHTVQYGYIFDGDQMVDEVLVLIMKGPHSYTAEDTVEIDCHGGILMMKKVLELAIHHGARLADPGEFTKRAFLNGRIDLSQAEAVMDVIHAKNDYALKSSVSQLRGGISKRIKRLRESLIYEIAFIESALDDPEHISLDGYPSRLRKNLDSMKKEIEKLIDSSGNGRIMMEGIRTVIMGKPNVGKSSLLNLLVGEERAIVTEIAGTTRDTLEEHISFHGISLNIVDTAGIRNTDDVVEQIGVSKAKDAAKDADLIIYVVDGSIPLDENDREIIRMIRERKALILLNKSDLAQIVESAQLECLTGHHVIPISAKEETGIEDLEKEILSMFYEGRVDFNDQVYVTNVRHKTALIGSLESLKLVEHSIQNHMPEDFYSIDLMDAYEQLGSIIGEAVEDDLINEIFAKFCMGK